tara:strand:+ start:533 stop:1687 length:1155 start_codon:yes stop_codon:yes gene_type:complete
MSTLKVNAIRQTAASSDAVTLASDGSCTVKATNNLSNRNFIINGAMQFAQRGSSFTATGDEYTLDRWRHSHGSSFNFDTTTTQESSGPDGFGNSLKITPDSVVTPSGGENGIIEQYIEGQNLQGLAFGTSSAKSVTVSFYAKSAASNANDQYTVWVQMYNSAGNRFIKNKAFTVTASWQRFSITFTGNTSENIINTNAIGLRLGLILSSGPDDIAAEKTSWEDSNFWTSVTGQSNFMDNTSNEFHLSGVQVEAGDVATDFEHRSYADELLSCQRYFFMIADGSVQTSAGIADGRFLGAGEVDFMVQFPVTMRTTPSIYQVTGGNYFKIMYAGYNQYVDGNWTLQYQHPNGTSHYATPDSNGSADKPAQIVLQNAAARLGYQAEL